MALTRDPEAWARLGRALRDERHHQGLTQDELADRAGVSTKSVQEAEAGKVPRARMPYTIPAIAGALGWKAGAVDAVLSGQPAPGAEQWARRPAGPLTDKEAAAVIRDAMVQATDQVTAAEIREATRIAVEELRRRGMLHTSDETNREDIRGNAS